MASRKLPVYAPGSSPRMRGARDSVRVPPAVFGIIPAYAGSTTIFQEERDA